MTPANAEASIMRLTEGLATITESHRNLQSNLIETKATMDVQARRVDELAGRQEQRLAELTTSLALLRKDVDDLKNQAENSKRNRWALFIAILSALLSLASAILVAFFKRN